MKLITVLLNNEKDYAITSMASTLLRKVTFKYKVKGSIVETGFNKFVPNINDIRLFIFIHPPSHLHSLLKKLVEVAKLNEYYHIVCVIGTSRASAFPGTFSISRFCNNCMALIKYCKENQSIQPMLCNCNNGPLLNIYPPEPIEDYFAFS